MYAPAYDRAASVLESSRKLSIDGLNVQKGQNILIVGAGTGMDLNYLPKGCKIIATDITTAMVKRIKTRNEKLGHNLEAMVMDGQKLEFADKTFDIVILHLILAVIPDPYKTIIEAERVLKPGGQIAVFDKFIAQDQQPSIIRKILNLFTYFFFSNINRKFEDLLAVTQLTRIKDQKANLGGLFRIILLKK